MENWYEIYDNTIRAVGPDVPVGDIIIPDGVFTIGAMGFQACMNITSVVIPEGVNTIRGYAFNSCKKLERVSFPSSLLEIQEYAFGNCTSLKSVTIPDTVRMMRGMPAFSGCESLTEINVVHNDNQCGGDRRVRSDDGVLYSHDGRTLLFYPPAKACDEYVIPDGVEYIAAAFCYTTNLRSVVIPASIIKISSSAFSGSSVEEIRFLGGDKVYIKPHMFAYCNTKRIIAPEIRYSKFANNKYQAACGYAKAYFEGITTGSRINMEYENFISSEYHRGMLYIMAARDIWLLRYMTERSLIPTEDIDRLLDDIPEDNREMRAMLLEYSKKSGGNTQYDL